MAASDDLDDIKLLIELLDQEGLLEIEVEADGRRVLVRSDAAVAADVSGAPAVPAGPALEVVAPPQETGAAEDAEGTAAEAVPENWTPITSPMAGVFYRASSPDALAYVNEGDAVEAGDVLALVEAMKVFNPIVAEVGGRIARVVPENEAQIEAEEVLFYIEQQ
ncbi:MAG: acetyl-CoA carboxylase, biotin carboxyl carrier protein [Armatimonadota bacterium]|jgi:acetyl-CoA carboxylase biotin carboxyl carrier protein